MVSDVADEDRWVVHERLHPEHEALVPDTLSAPLWQKLLRAALLARSMRLPAAPEGGGTAGTSLRRMGGCFVRLVLAAVVLIVGVVAALYLYGSSLL